MLNNQLLTPPDSPTLKKPVFDFHDDEYDEPVKPVEKFHDELGIINYTFAELSILFKDNLFQLIMNYNDYLFSIKQKILLLYEINFSSLKHLTDNADLKKKGKSNIKLKTKLFKQFESRYIELFENLYMANYEIWSFRKKINLIIMTMKHRQFIDKKQVFQLNNKVIHEIKLLQRRYNNNDDDEIEGNEEFEKPENEESINDKNNVETSDDDYNTSDESNESDNDNYDDDNDEDEFKIELLDRCPELCQDLLDLDTYLFNKLKNKIFKN